MERGWDPGMKKPKHDTGGVKVNQDGSLEEKKRIMPCGAQVADTEEAEYSYRSNCDKCTTLF